jgi:hypothetical protein
VFGRIDWIFVLVDIANSNVGYRTFLFPLVLIIQETWCVCERRVDSRVHYCYLFVLGAIIFCIDSERFFDGI